MSKVCLSINLSFFMSPVGLKKLMNSIYFQIYFLKKFAILLSYIVFFFYIFNCCMLFLWFTLNVS